MSARISPRSTCLYSSARPRRPASSSRPSSSHSDQPLRAISARAISTSPVRTSQPTPPRQHHALPPEPPPTTLFTTPRPITARLITPTTPLVRPPRQSRSVALHHTSAPFDTSVPSQIRPPRHPSPSSQRPASYPTGRVTSAPPMPDKPALICPAPTSHVTASLPESDDPRPHAPPHPTNLKEHT